MFMDSADDKKYGMDVEDDEISLQANHYGQSTNEDEISLQTDYTTKMPGFGSPSGILKRPDPQFSLDDYILDEDYELYDWNREPVKSEINACRPHIDELLESFQPHGVVYLGKVAESYENPKYLVPLHALSEPLARLFRHTQIVSPTNKDFIYRHPPTLSLYHPGYIARLEYKLLTLRKEARKLDTFVERFIQE